MSELLRPVSDPAKQVVTDPAVLAAIARHRLSPQDVRFAWDYCGSYPRSKKYHVLPTGESILVTSNLPMARPDDNSLIVPLLEPGAGKWYVGNNLFSGEVSASGRIALALNVAQPGGIPAGSSVAWEPVLFLDSAVVSPVHGPVLLEVDPFNSLYSQNVLEWDYGFCLRHVRVIQGRLCERWTFGQAPSGAVRIVHHHSGQFRLGPYATDPDSEQLTLAQFGAAQFPLVVNATLEVYPDSNPESATVDGYVRRADVDEAWSSLLSGAGNQAADDNASGCPLDLASSGTSGQWKTVSRGVLLFDTSALTASAVVSSAVLSPYATGNKYDNIGASPAAHVCASNPASNAALVTGDFSTLGSASFGSLSWASWAASAYNNISLNPGGLAAINKTGVTRLGLRSSNDLENSAPAWPGSYVSFAMDWWPSEKGAGYKPKLTITYTTGWSGNVGGVSDPAGVGGLAAGSIAKIGGIS